jgi:hypothetical protein
MTARKRKTYTNDNGFEVYLSKGAEFLARDHEVECYLANGPGQDPDVETLKLKAGMPAVLASQDAEDCVQAMLSDSVDCGWRVVK